MCCQLLSKPLEEPQLTKQVRGLDELGTGRTYRDINSYKISGHLSVRYNLSATRRTTGRNSVTRQRKRQNFQILRRLQRGIKSYL